MNFLFEKDVWIICQWKQTDCKTARWSNWKELLREREEYWTVEIKTWQLTKFFLHSSQSLWYANFLLHNILFLKGYCLSIYKVASLEALRLALTDRYTAFRRPIRCWQGCCPPLLYGQAALTLSSKLEK